MAFLSRMWPVKQMPVEFFNVNRIRISRAADRRIFNEFDQQCDPNSDQNSAQIVSRILNTSYLTESYIFLPSKWNLYPKIQFLA